VTGSSAVLIYGLLATAFAAAIARSARWGSDAIPFVLAVTAALLLSPIVWIHYYVLLLVPIALSRPRLSGLWFAPFVYWATPQPESFGSIWRLVVGIGFTLSVCGLATFSLTRVRDRPSGEAPAWVV
jgi:hypothetical protein